MESKRIPLVSFIIPAYNAGEFIGEAIRSVQSQSMTDWELIVVDDASRDNTAEIVAAMAADDSRIRIILSPHNSGHAFTPRKIAIEAASSELISPLDADDWIDPDYLERLYSRMSADDADIIYPTMVVENPDHPFSIPSDDFDTEAIYQGRDMVRHTLNGWTIGAGGGIIRRRLYLDCIAAVGQDNFIFSDELLTRLLLANARRVVISESLYHYRHNVSSVTNQTSSKAFGMLTCDRLLQDYIEKTYGRESEEYIKVSVQRFFTIVNGLRRYSHVRRRLNPFGRKKARLMLKQSYAETDWALIRANIGWKYYRLMRLGLVPAALFMGIYDRFRRKE